MEETPRQRFRRAFHKKKHVFLVAIHVGPGAAQWISDINIAHEAEADGIIVIKDYETLATDSDVLEAYGHAKRTYSPWWIGVNLLDHNANQAVAAIPRGTDGLWIDRSYVEEHKDGGQYLDRVYRDLAMLRHTTLLLASIAFKYQAPVKDYALVTSLAAPHADVLITSGERTGAAADLDKVRIMRAATKGPLGLASGVSADNVQQYLDLDVDLFIVNTRISNPETKGLDPAKVEALRKKIPR